MDKQDKDIMKVYEIRIWGVVQGVGFRPFVHRVAKEHDLVGFVSNDGAGVFIVIRAEEKQLGDFIQDIKVKKPQASEIVRLEVTEAMGLKVSELLNSGFRINQSTDNSDSQVFISPDLAVCDNCLKDLYEDGNRRYLHPFISCMECGPRYSIIETIPYDRENTTMSDFSMCSSCSKEYKSIEDRRYHAQTISCHECGPQLKFRKMESDDEIIGSEAFKQYGNILKQGGVIAVKGIGGFHLCCSPFDTKSVELLRELKGREEKPLAVMFEDLAQIGKYCIVSEEEKRQLLSRERPIVLLIRKDSEISEAVFKSSRYLGCFLPYTPLHKILISSYGPVVMTSANLSGEPIITDNERIMSLDGNKLSGVLYNDRRILTGIDDSVIKVSPKNGNLFIRRARGFVPLPLYLGDRVKNCKPILACGSDLKNTFCLVKNGYAYLSQYGGDLEGALNFTAYAQNINRLKRLLGIKNEKICCDLHPGYQSSKYAKEKGVEVFEVQHHYAHILSVMAEKNLRNQVIGVAFDGTGYGTDGNMWGGEFLIASPENFKRVGHLMYVPMLGGDSSVRDAWKTGYSYLYSAGLELNIEDERWPLIKAALTNNINKVMSSSMGRFFDAVSFLAGVKGYSSFEGECAIELENYAAEYLESYKLQDKSGRDILEKPENWSNPYDYDIIDFNKMFVGDMNRCISEIVSDTLNGLDKTAIAWRFHLTAIDYVLKMCTRIREIYKINDVALGGGVFQNSIIFEGTVNVLKMNGFEVHFNTKVPVNDGGISLGQAYAAMFTDS